LLLELLQRLGRTEVVFDLLGAPGAGDFYECRRQVRDGRARSFGDSAWVSASGSGADGRNGSRRASQKSTIDERL
jgi:hypothetical protein